MVKFPLFTSEKEKKALFLILILEFCLGTTYHVSISLSEDSVLN